MKPCRYRGFVFDDTCECSHSHILHREPGIARLTTCDTCPYRINGDFFTATNRLLIRKQATGEYTANPRPCGCSKPVQKRLADTLQFVYPYWHAGSVGDELLWSIRSIESHYNGTAEVLVIGDCPPWYRGPYIPQRRVPANTPNRAFRDMLSKMITLSGHALVRPVFVWMMDDIYAVKPFTLADIVTPRAEPWRASKGNSWQRIKANTMRALEQVGRTTHDYATHLCHVTEKPKLAALLAEFELHRNTMLWEVLYGNTYRGQPSRCRPFFARIHGARQPEQYSRLIGNATFFNHNSSGWCPQLREWLAERLPTPASTEPNGIGRPSPPARKKPVREVLRRPIETHRAYIAAQGAK